MMMEVVYVRGYVMRMHKCGIPLRTAVKIYDDFKRRGKLESLTQYIDYVEAING